MAANRQTDRHTHARVQCSHASVGLAQARPNNRIIPEHPHIAPTSYDLSSASCDRAKLLIRC